MNLGDRRCRIRASLALLERLRHVQGRLHAARPRKTDVHHGNRLQNCFVERQVTCPLVCLAIKPRRFPSEVDNSRGLAKADLWILTHASN